MDEGATPVDRVAMVTGGASGIGRATVLRFLRDGVRVAFGDLNEAAGERLCAEVDRPERLAFVPGDASVERDVAELVDTAVRRWGRLDAAFPNAGVGGAYGSLLDVHAEDWDRTFSVIGRGAFLGTQLAARAMIGLGIAGSIITMSSVAGLVGGAGPTAYSAAKAAVVNFTANAAVELAPHRIRVNAVCPGLVDTPMVMGRDRDAVVERMRTFQPWPDLGTPDEVAAVVAWLAGPESRFVTGEAIRIDGGMTAWGPRTEQLHDSAGVTRRHAGFSWGTTGRPPVKRGPGGAPDGPA